MPSGGLLIDLDGTLYHGNNMIEGADTLIRHLQQREIRYLFVTNNSSATAEVVADRLRAMGIPASADDICTSSQAAAAYIAQELNAPRVFTVGEDGLRDALTKAGLQLVDDQPDIVVQGIDRQLTYERIAAAVRHIRDGAVYILTNPDVLLPSDTGLIPGAGSISAILQKASGVEPVIIGKPSAILMNYALERLGQKAEDVWVIGDNPATDIAAAKASGCRSVLVLTGLASEANYQKLLEQAGCAADEIIADLHQLIRWLG